MEADRLAEIREWYAVAAPAPGEYVWMRRADVDDLLEAVEWRDTDRWAGFSEKEQAALALGLALLSIDMTDGLFTGAPSSPQALAQELPGIIRLVDELSRRTGNGGIDVVLQGGLAAVLDQRAAEAAEYGNPQGGDESVEDAG